MLTRQPYFLPQGSRPRPTNSDIVPLELANLRLPDPSQSDPAPGPSSNAAPRLPQLSESASASPALPAAPGPAQAPSPSSPSASSAQPPAASTQSPAHAPASVPAAPSEAPSGYAPLVERVIDIIPDPRLPQPPINALDKQPRDRTAALPAKLPRFRRRKTSRGPATPATALPRYVIVPSHHARHCSICNHPEREGLEEEFLRWENPYNTALDYGVKERAIYRHAHALRLYDKRERNVKYALGHVIQRLDSIDISSDAAIRAVRLFTRLTGQGEFVEPSTHESPVRSDVLERSAPRFGPALAPQYASPATSSLDAPAPLAPSPSTERYLLRDPSSRSRKRSARPSRKKPSRSSSSRSAASRSASRRASSRRAPDRRKNKKSSRRKNSGAPRR
jgi:hypothetical protein